MEPSEAESSSPQANSSTVVMPSLASQASMSLRRVTCVVEGRDWSHPGDEVYVSCVVSCVVSCITAVRAVKMAGRLGLAWLGGLGIARVLHHWPSGLVRTDGHPLWPLSRPSPCRATPMELQSLPYMPCVWFAALSATDRHMSAFCLASSAPLHSPWLALEPTRLTLSKRLRRLTLPLPPPPVTQNTIAIILLRACQPHPSFSSHEPFIILHDSPDGSGSDSIRSHSSVRQ